MNNQYKSEVPAGKRGRWKVEKFEISESEASFHRLQCSIHGNSRGVESGTYTKLTRDGHIIMSDTPAEIRDHIYFIHIAEGSILISGLGLGIVVEALLQKETVTSITVIEKEQNVIDLVAPHLTPSHKIAIIQDDIFDWVPPKDVTYNHIWHDIWEDICGDNWPEMKRLKRKFCRKKHVFQGCWCEAEVKRSAAEDRARERERAYWSS